MVEAEHHERVGVGQHPFVDRELVAGLVDALEDRHWVPSGLLGQLLERQGGAVEEFQGARDALQEVRRVILRRLVGGPQDIAHLGHGGEAVLHRGRITLRFPGVAPRPVDADAPPSGVFTRGVALVIGASAHGDPLVAECGEVAQGVDSRQKEIRPAGERCEGRYPLVHLADWAVGDGEIQCAVLGADDRVVLVAEFVEGLVVDPDVLGELELADQVGADDERGDAAVRPVVGCVVGQGGSVGRPAPDHATAVHVVGGVAGIEPACV